MLPMFRFIIALIYVILFCILTLPVLGVILFIGIFSKKTMAFMAQKVLSLGAKILLFISGTKLTLTGLENIPKDRAVVIVANHQSYYDIFISIAILKNPAGFLAKKELKKIPILSFWMRISNTVFLDRQNPRKGIEGINRGISNIKNGTSMVIFPEGTRSKDGRLGEFHSGSLRIPNKTNCPIVPLAIKGTRDIFENHFPMIKSCRVSFRYGKPISQEGLSAEDKKALPSTLHNTIQDMLLAME